jgi:DNA-binding transcriptional LysR family regulator
MVELRHLRYFIAVAEELHFSRAAERLCMAQPPLSQQIQQLEQDLGVLLFQRKTKRQVQLTEAGQVLLQEAYQVLAHLERAARLTQQTGQGERGQLAIGFTSPIACSLLPGVLRQFREQFPAVRLVLHELTTAQQEQALHDRLIQVGFGYPPFADDRLNRRCVLQEPLVVALPNGHPLAKRTRRVAIASLMNEPFILFPRDLGKGLYDQILRLCQQAAFMPNVTQEAVQMQTILSLVSAGMGISLVPSSMQNLQRAGVVYRVMQQSDCRIETDMIWRQDEPAPVLRQFLNVVKAASADQG